MGVRILVGREQGRGDEIACLFCSTSGTAFGPVFLNGEEQAEEFLRFLNGEDPRRFSDQELFRAYGKFLNRNKSATA